jgi:hypothetical protein
MAIPASPSHRFVRQRGQHLTSPAGTVRTGCPGRPVSGVSDLHGSTATAGCNSEQTQVLINEQLVVDLYSR